MLATVELPAGWFDRTVLTYIGPDTGAGSPSLVVSRDELGERVPLGRYAAMQDAAIRAGLEHVERLQDERARLAGRPALRLGYRWTLHGHTMRQWVWCVVDGSTGYAITATAADAEFDALAVLFQAAADSFSC